MSGMLSFNERNIERERGSRKRVASFSAVSRGDAADTLPHQASSTFCPYLWCLLWTAISVVIFAGFQTVANIGLYNDVSGGSSVETFFLF
ncbi:hypothetical protein HanRHA438_Chr17g0830941 [Helianthus annuus]|nr:hypothetical protein HanRHA438_Chr17g0830941 [Helianthus annuus]